MDLAIAALNKTLFYYLIQSGLIVLLIVIMVVWLCKGGDDKIAVLTLALIVLFVCNVFISVVPFLKDYSQQQIAVVEGVYKNAGATNGRASAAGIHSVTITHDDETISLTTIFADKETFPAGEYQVVAYYTPNSKILLHIEIMASTV